MEQRVEGSLKRIDAEASAMQRNLEKSHLRKLQGRCLREGAKCCDNLNATAEETQECIQRSQQPVAQVQAIIKKELEDFQQRLQRCMLTCQDRVKDTMVQGSNGMDEKMEKAFGDCMCSCADDHLKLIPLMQQRLLTALPKV